MNTKSKTEHIPHSTQFELLTKKLLCLFSACGVIPSLSREEIEEQMAPEKYVGRAPSQVTEFLDSEIAPLLERYPDESIHAELNV